ncbi:hypothetical protein BDN72DRAFT_897242 [Pluteus cervinus]|uniref:Uncharacterized protein n=1 Tax=Pluteus cervinus TaxID=181527 RepID=A0ACD3AUF4_9AGAR|nr:hypothetical protein BDN72DRAFT_897242 [Pluteus cervinus]
MIAALPQLPVELLEVIFQLTARESTGTATTLLQVSKWVRHCIEPILYETVVVNNHEDSILICYPPHFKTRSINIPDFFKEYGRHILCLSIDPPNPEQEVVDALKLCPSLKNLVIPGYCSAGMIETIQEYLPNLERLSGRIEGYHAWMDSTKATYRQLTHLDMIGWYEWDDWSRLLTQLPSLTHLALDDTDNIEYTMIPGSLKGCRKLLALLLVSEGFSVEEACREDVADPRGTEIDERIVVVTIRGFDNWLNGVRGGLDMWTLADRVISERQSSRKREGTKDIN